MTLTNAIKKAEKITGQKAIVKGQFYTFTFLGSTIQFAKNGQANEVTNIYTKKIGLQDDLTTDYFAGTFHDNLSQAFNFLEKSY